MRELFRTLQDIALARRHSVRGFPVSILNPRRDIDSRDALDRLAQALDLIATYAPHRLRRMRQDIQRIVVRRFPCRGAFFPDTRECLTELTFTVNRRHTIAEIAASIIHEGTHARIAAMCGPLSGTQRAREERLCRKAELDFGMLLPDGKVVVERATLALGLGDRDVAPAVDWAEGARRVAAADRTAN
jgi:hypothetical protein